MLAIDRKEFASKMFAYMASLMFCIVMLGGMTAFVKEVQAQDTGWELNAGLGFGTVVGMENGIYTVVRGGYRMTDWFSLNVEQAFMPYFYEQDGSSKRNYLGNTSVILKFIWINDDRDFEMYFKLGGGVFYSKHKSVMWTVPTGIGMNYYFNDQVGMGIDVQYDWGWGWLTTDVHVAVRF